MKTMLKRKKVVKKDVSSTNAKEIKKKINQKVKKNKIKNEGKGSLKTGVPTTKNSYIKGIKLLIKEYKIESSETKLLTQRGLSHLDMSVKQESVSIRKLKNRESAKNSRKRRKLYIELMERKILDQKKEIDKLKAELEVYSKRRARRETSILPLGIKSLMLQNISWASNFHQNVNLKQHLEDYHKKIGVNGNRRKDYIIQAFQKIEENSLPDFSKSILNSAEYKIDMFSQHYQGMTTFKEKRVAANDICQKIKMTHSQINQFNQHSSFLKKLNSEYKSWCNEIEKCIQNYKIFTKKAGVIFTNLFQILNPSQLSKLTLAFEEDNIYPSKDINYNIDESLEMNSMKSMESFPSNLKKSFRIRKTSEENSISDNNSNIFPNFSFNNKNFFEIKSNDPLLDIIK